MKRINRVIKSFFSKIPKEKREKDWVQVGEILPGRAREIFRMYSRYIEKREDL